jgi:hypothetical protein
MRRAQQRAQPPERKPGWLRPDGNRAHLRVARRHLRGHDHGRGRHWKYCRDPYVRSFQHSGRHRGRR